MAVETQQGTPHVSRRVAEASTILRCLVGSEVHGLDVAGASDRDELGVCVEPPKYVIGLRAFEQYVYRTRPDGVRSGPGDLDLTIYGLRKFCSLALKGNPSILLLLNVPDSACSVLTQAGRALRANHRAFASKKAGAAFLGYMQQQRQRLTGERGQMNVKRPELVSAHGYDTKYAGHILRLAYQGISYMQYGSFPIPMPEHQRDTILQVRSGGMRLPFFLELAEGVEEHLKRAIFLSPLPALPDYDAVNRFLVHQYMRSWAPTEHEEDT